MASFVYVARETASGREIRNSVEAATEQAAIAALRAGLLEYDRRLGYRGPEGFVELAADADEDDFDEALAERADDEELRLALVLATSPREVQVVLKNGERISIAGEGLRFAARSLERTSPQRRIRRGAILRVQRLDASDRKSTRLNSSHV